MAFDPLPAGWHRRVRVRRFLAVGERQLTRVCVTPEENADDGVFEVEGEAWAIEAGGDHHLVANLEEALGQLTPDQLRSAVVSDRARWPTP